MKRINAYKPSYFIRLRKIYNLLSGYSFNLKIIYFILPYLNKSRFIFSFCYVFNRFNSLWFILKILKSLPSTIKCYINKIKTWSAVDVYKSLAKDINNKNINTSITNYTILIMIFYITEDFYFWMIIAYIIVSYSYLYIVYNKYLCINYPGLYKVLAIALDGLWNIFTLSIWTIIFSKFLDAIISNILKMFSGNWGSPEGSPRGPQGSPEPSDPNDPNKGDKVYSVLGKRRASHSPEREDINKRFKTPELEDVNPLEGPSEDAQIQPRAQLDNPTINPLDSIYNPNELFNNKLKNLHKKLKDLLQKDNNNSPNKGKTMNSRALKDGLIFSDEDRNFMEDYLKEKHPSILETGPFGRTTSKGSNKGKFTCTSSMTSSILNLFNPEDPFNRRS